MNRPRDRLPGTATCTQAAVTPRNAGLADSHHVRICTGIQHDRSCTGQGPNGPFVVSGRWSKPWTRPYFFSTNQGRL